MENKVLLFDLFGRFAHFHQPLTVPTYLKRSYNVIPRPTLLGVLGAILGYEGYGEGKTEPEFYKRLKNLKIFIEPSASKFPFKKTLVTYNSLNSFANARDKNPNMLIQEEVLVEPYYTIGIIVHEQKDKILIDHILNRKSSYHLYLGKNEFFANVEPYTELFDLQMEETFGPFKIDSVFASSILDDSPEKIIYDAFIKEIDFSSKPPVPISDKIAFLYNKEYVQIRNVSDLYVIPKLNKRVYFY